MPSPNFQISREDFLIIERIAERAWQRLWIREVYEKPLGVQIDVALVHANGTPLHLDQLLNGDDSSFDHDIAVIWNWLDRDTGQLKGGALRFGQRDAA